MKKILIIFTCLWQLSCFNSLSAARLDTLQLKRTFLNIKIKPLSAKQIQGVCTQYIKLKTNTNYVDFDLAGMQVDSILLEKTQLSFVRMGERVRVQLGITYQKDDSLSITFYYRGTPAIDPSGWGGFIFSGDYAFNLGVGFKVNPHSFGRAWFPCIDEFEMKSKYEFLIETDTNYTAACNGLLIKDSISTNTRYWRYVEPNPISAYLASLSVSKYSIVKSNYQGVNSTYPIFLYVAPSDSLRVKSSFENLPNAISIFEDAFGAQPFAKVGFNLVPFMGGAMEHAGNITYPLVFADGTKSYEYLFAHELSHHWWGDKVTCKTAEDMWLNEGWASYCEHLFTQKMYGETAYKQGIAANHLDVLRWAHIRDSGNFALNQIPHGITYGNHVYKKAADVIHSLRNIMGDSLFFLACKNYLNTYAYANANTNDMQNVFAAFGGGKVYNFFENWIKEKGSPHAYLAKQIHSGSGPYNLKIFVRQNPRFTDKIYKELPYEVFFFKDANTYEKRTILLNNEVDSFEFEFSFKPIFVCLDYDAKLSDAITESVLKIKNSGWNNLPASLCRVKTNRIKDSALIRIEHHWVAPEKYKSGQPIFSKDRYFTVDGIWNESDSFDLELTYDGRKSMPSNNIGGLDNELNIGNEDSLTVYYRAFPGDYWRVCTNLIFTRGNKLDKYGKILVAGAQKGDYVFAYYDYNRVGLKQNKVAPKIMRACYPNPADEIINLEALSDEVNAKIFIYSSSGLLVYSTTINAEKRKEINISNFNNGVYTIVIQNMKTLQTEVQKVVIIH